MKLTKHGYQRYVERVVGIEETNSRDLYIANNETSIINNINQMIENGSELYKGKNFFQEYTKEKKDRINPNLPIRIVLYNKYILIVGLDSVHKEDMIITIIDATKSGGRSFYNSIGNTECLKDAERTRMYIKLMNARRGKLTISF